jgi:hypothetical protein
VLWLEAAVNEMPAPSNCALVPLPKLDEQPESENNSTETVSTSLVPVMAALVEVEGEAGVKLLKLKEGAPLS